MSRYFVFLLLGMAVVAVFEWRTDEDILTMLALLIGSAALGAYRPSRFALSGIIMGSTITLVGLFSLTTGLQPVYGGAPQGHQGSVLGAMSMLVLTLPALLASFVGQFVSGKVQRA